MGLSDLADKAKGLLNRRGGSATLKEDARELKDVEQGKGDPATKAREAFEAVKEPGARDDKA